MKKTVCILTAIISLFFGSYIAKAENLESIIDESKSFVSTAHGPLEEDGADLPLLLAEIKLKEEVKVSELIVHYINSNETRNLIDEFRLVNDTTFQEYNSGIEINNTSVPLDKIIYYIGSLKTEETFAITDFTEAIYNIEYTNSNNRIIREEGTITRDNKVTVTSIKDFTDFIEFKNTFEEKFPDVYGPTGDNEMISLVFRPGYKEIGNKDYNFDNEIKMGEITYVEGKKIEEYYKDVENMLKKLNITINDSAKIDESMLKGIKSINGISTYEQKENDKVLYAWTFDGTKMTDEDVKLNINLEVSIGTSINSEKIDKLINTNEANLKLDFKHSGALPTGTMVTVDVTSKFKDNEILDLYYYNPTDNTLEKVASNITVTNGYAKFNLSHCSEYVLKPHIEEVIKKEEVVNKAPNNAQTSSLNVILYGGIALASLIGIGYLIKSKKEK